MQSKISGDGNSALVGGYHHHAHGESFVWQFNEETYEWGRFGPNYDSFTAGVPHYEQFPRNSGVGHHGHCLDISADGRSVVVSGHWRGGHWENKIFLWQYNPETAEWGKFNADGSFQKPTSSSDHSSPWMHSSTDSFTSGCGLSPDGSTFFGMGNGKTRIWRGVIVEPEYTVVPYSGGASSGSGLTIGTLSELTTELQSVVFEELKAGGGAGLVIPTVNYDDSDFNTNSHNGDYYWSTSTRSHSSQDMFSGDGKRMIIHSHTSQSGGRVYVYAVSYTHLTLPTINSV